MNGGTVSSVVYNIGNLQTNGILLPPFANCQVYYQNSLLVCVCDQQISDRPARPRCLIRAFTVRTKHITPKEYSGTK